MVLAQSDLLLNQSQEARHYTMFFACGAYAFYMTTLNNKITSRKHILIFLAHTCLCQVHYTGIIFSGLIGASYLMTCKNKSILNKIPKSIIFAWIISLPIYFYFIHSQNSILNNWHKPKDFENLLDSYNNSILYISFFIPVILIFIMDKEKKIGSREVKESFSQNQIAIVCSILWSLTPILFWGLAHLTSLNLFVDRYLIPKEIGIIFLMAWFLQIISQDKLPLKSTILITTCTTLFSIICILINTKRIAFGLRKETNYHHSLILDKNILYGQHRIVLNDDPTYFPNEYLNREKFAFEIKDKKTKQIYKTFSKKINIR